MNSHECALCPTLHRVSSHVVVPYLKGSAECTPGIKEQVPPEIATCGDSIKSNHDCQGGCRHASRTLIPLLPHIK